MWINYFKRFKNFGGTYDNNIRTKDICEASLKEKNKELNIMKEIEFAGDDNQELVETKKKPIKGMMLLRNLKHSIRKN